MVDLETVDTEDLINELKRRSRVFFLAMRSMAKQGQDSLFSVGINGTNGTDSDEDRDIVVGFAMRAIKEVHNAE